VPADPIALGTLLAAAAALAFGATTPFIQRLGVGVGPFGTAALLYLGATLGAAARSRSAREPREARVRARHVPRLLAVAFLGAALAPALFAWGLQRVPATCGALLLNFEAVFTVGLAALVHREHVSGRVTLAVALMSLGGCVTVLGASFAGRLGLVGGLAVVAAVLCWALDNVLTRPFADLDPAAVVRVKALCGAALTGAAAVLGGEPRPAWAAAAGLLACGATGYGLSLRLYLLAQRRIGAGRTGSVFALAPFVGALTALAMGDRPAGLPTAVAAALFLAGLALHLTERHRHAHHHEALVHEHAHTHDDGHHQHAHGSPPPGPHSHPHRHEPATHAHPHGPDAHHGHVH
jgi:drug/metabolite transporter (DMT)-like permease